MPRTCTICSHQHRYEIEELLATRRSTYRAIALQYGVSKDAVSRHVSSRHVSQLQPLQRTPSVPPEQTPSWTELRL